MNEVKELEEKQLESNNDSIDDSIGLNIHFEAHTWWKRSDGTIYLKITKNPPYINIKEFDYNCFKLDTYVGYINQYGHKIISCYMQGSMNLFNI